MAANRLAGNGTATIQDLLMIHKYLFLTAVQSNDLVVKGMTAKLIENGTGN